MADDGRNRSGGLRGNRFAYPTRMSRDMRGSGKGHWVMDISGDAEALELATSTRARLRGMLFRDPDEITRLLVPCHDIHTFGMHHPLDIAFISREGCVLEVHRNVSGRRRIRRKEASMVAERFSRSGDWLQAGDVVRLGTAGRGSERRGE